MRLFSFKEHPSPDQGFAGARIASCQASPIRFGASDRASSSVVPLTVNWRSAAAFGASCVAFGPGTADPFSPKAVRASMGAIFSVPVARIRSVGQLPRPRVALVAGAAEQLHGPGEASANAETPGICVQSWN